MRQVVIPDLTSGLIRIPGGWMAWVPEFRADATYETALSEALHGKHREPLKEAQRRIQEMAEVEFLSRLKDFIKRYAEAYAKRFPHLVNPDHTLEGFDPESLQLRFIPGSRSAGNTSKAYIAKALTEMAGR